MLRVPPAALFAIASSRVVTDAERAGKFTQRPEEESGGNCPEVKAKRERTKRGNVA